MHGGSSGSSERIFDMSQESDVIDVLKVVRHSLLDGASKDEIRDTVFLVRSQSSPALLSKLQTYVAPLKLTIAGAVPVVETESVTAETSKSNTDTTTAATTRAGFATGRLQPQFSQAQAPVHKPAVTAPADDASSDTPKPTTAPPKTTDLDPKEVTDTPTPPTPEPVPTPPVSAAAASAPLPTPDTGAHPDAAARIVAIKQAVNAKVGNPVNLIDSTNEVGREYMNALLAAMKATQGGGETAAAMQRLEAAYTAVERSLNESPATATAKKSSDQAEEAPMPASEATPKSNPTPATPPASKPDTKYKEPTAVAAEVTATDSTTGASESAATKANSTASDTAKLSETITPLQSAATAAGANNTTIPQPPEPETPAEPVDPLMTERVSDGLSQLLTEWNIFKSSGFLGTGSKGAAHPLYQELRNVPMNLVVAGRFEGATLEVKQSIRDYMNGWRYEQGITHDLKETFEHYLRRVVKTIVDKQQETQ